jgi:hypothetical protein
MRAAKNKAGAGSGIHRLAANKVHGTIRPNPKGHKEPAEHDSKRGEDYGTPVQHNTMDGFPSKMALSRKRGGAASGKWIKGAISHPGALHKELHVPAGEKIPAKKLDKAAHSSNPKERKRAVLAKTLSGFHHKD